MWSIVVAALLIHYSKDNLYVCLILYVFMPPPYTFSATFLAEGKQQRRTAATCLPALPAFAAPLTPRLYTTAGNSNTHTACTRWQRKTLPSGNWPSGGNIAMATLQPAGVTVPCRQRQTTLFASGCRCARRACRASQPLLQHTRWQHAVLPRRTAGACRAWQPPRASVLLYICHIYIPVYTCSCHVSMCMYKY